MEPHVPTYHDVMVYVDGRAYCPWQDARLELTCDKAGGWCLWFKHWAPTQMGPTQLIGGEFEGRPFRIEIAGQVVCDSAAAKRALEAEEQS